MKTFQPALLRRILMLFAVLLILRVTIGVIIGYRDYFPPNFDSDFLKGRELRFSPLYQVAFYTHIASGPITLLLGLFLMSDSLRLKYPKWHRNLGKIQILTVLGLVTPSGLWMACDSISGPIASLGFAGLAVATGMCAALGWRTAVQRRFAEHRRWMWRCYLLLCSAVALRVTIGLAITLGIEGLWIYPATAWTSWLLPLLAFELVQQLRMQRRRIPLN